jgi:hypothetical protein
MFRDQIALLRSQESVSGNISYKHWAALRPGTLADLSRNSKSEPWGYAAN